MLSQMQFEELLTAVGECKARETCSHLQVRGNFFEPNPRTLTHWQGCHQDKFGEGFYKRGVDRRIMFVCESPSAVTPSSWGTKMNECDEERWSDGDFSVAGVTGFRPWDQYTRHAALFRTFREDEGLGSCWITNVVKCGRLEGRNGLKAIEDKPDPDEIGACSQFLIREVELIQPLVLACMGGWAYDKARSFLGRRLNLAQKPIPVKFWHYSARASDVEIRANWASSLLEVQRELRSLGRSPFQPVYQEFESKTSV